MQFLRAVAAGPAAGLLLLLPFARGQEVDVTRIPGNPGWVVTNGAVLSVVQIKGRTALEVAQGPGKKLGAGGDRLVYCPKMEFADGEMEFDVLGSARMAQQSFVGVVFRLEAATGRYDAVYLRPFNFKSPEAEGRAHSVQYVSLPEWPWDRLRKMHPGVYEQPVPPGLDGDDWVHVRIAVRRPRVEVYLGGAPEPSLVVNELSGRTGGHVGLFAVGSQPAYFANLRITPRP